MGLYKDLKGYREVSHRSDMINMYMIYDTSNHVVDMVDIVQKFII